MSASKEFLRYGEVQTALEERGIGRVESRKLIALGVIKGQPLRKDGRDYYRWSQIEKDILTEAHTKDTTL